MPETFAYYVEGWQWENRTQSMGSGSRCKSKKSGDKSAGDRRQGGVGWGTLWEETFCHRTVTSLTQEWNTDKTFIGIIFTFFAPG
jgi:hypothetical protein